MSERDRGLARRLKFGALVVALVALTGCTMPTIAPFESPLAPAVGTSSPAAVVSPISPAAPTNAPAAPPSLTPAADRSAIVGTLRNSLGNLPEDAKVFVARFVWNDVKTVGVYYIDPANALSASIEKSGVFQVRNLEPGPYVLLIGVTPERAVPIMGDRNQARVIEAVAGQVTDMGQQTVELR